MALDQTKLNSIVADVEANVKVCSISKDFAATLTDPATAWANLLAATNVMCAVNAYAWSHKMIGKTERLTKTIVKIYDKQAALMSAQVDGWFKDAIKYKVGDPIPTFIAPNGSPSLDRYFALGISRIFAPAPMDTANFMDTADCISYLENAIMQTNRTTLVAQNVVIDAFRVDALNELKTEFPNGD